MMLGRLARGRVAYDFPSQGMTHLSQRGGFTMPQSDNVVGLERYDKILAVAIEGHLSLEGKGVFSKRLDDVKL